MEQTLDLAFRVQAYAASPPSRPVRLATVDDHPQIEEIAGHTFRHGRYNADPRFPLDLADRRYRHWVRSACTSTSPADRVYVVGKPGNVKGFFQLRLVEDRAEVGIMGVAESAKGSPAALDLMTGMHLDLKALGHPMDHREDLGRQHPRDQPGLALRLPVPERPGDLSLARAGCAASPASGGDLPVRPIDGQDTQYQWVYRIVSSASRSVESTTAPANASRLSSASAQARNTGKAGST